MILNLILFIVIGAVIYDLVFYPFWKRGEDHDDEDGEF